MGQCQLDPQAYLYSCKKGIRDRYAISVDNHEPRLVSFGLMRNLGSFF